MNLIYRPSAIHTAFNPAIIRFSDNNVEALTITITGNNKTITRSREFFNQEVQFNLSDFTRRLFEDKRTYFIANRVFFDSSLYIPYQVTYDSTTLNFVALNAVVQIGQSSDLTPKRGTFLTDFERIIKYEGYEYAVACLSFEGNTFYGFDGLLINYEIDKFITEPVCCLHVEEGKEYLYIRNKSDFEPLTDNSARYIKNNSGQIIYIYYLHKEFEERRIPIVNRCVPENPFYVRWINQRGGWDYWMFSFRQYKTRNVSDQITVNPVVYDQQTANSFTDLVTQTGVEKITVGASGLNKNESECVSKLIYSPRLQWYNESLNKWFTILVDKGENEIDTRSPAQNIEFTFILPTPQLQF